MMLGARIGAWAESGGAKPLPREVSYLESLSDGIRFFVEPSYVVANDFNFVFSFDFNVIEQSVNNAVILSSGSARSNRSVSIRVEDYVPIVSVTAYAMTSIVYRVESDGIFRVHFKDSTTAELYRDDELIMSQRPGARTPSNGVYLFSDGTGMSMKGLRIHGFTSVNKGAYIPYLDDIGAPCFHSVESGGNFYNSGVSGDITWGEL